MGETIAYARVSTDSGEQLSALRSQLAWLKDQDCSRILEDVESGLNPQRAGYQELLTAIKAGTVSKVVATQASRLGRDAIEFVNFVQVCDQHHCQISTRDDGVISCASPDELVMTFLKAAMSQGESMRLSKRVHKGREAGKALLKPMKRPCWPYKLSEDRLRLELRPEEAEIALRLLAQLKAAGWRMLPVLKAFPEETPFNSVRALRSWLLNPTIRGGIAYGQLANHQFEEVHWDACPALLSHEDFAEMQVVIARNRKLWGVHGSRTVRALTGLCVCSECGCRLKYISGRTFASLRCSGDLCSQHYKGVREEVVLRFATEVLPQVAAGKLAALIDQPEPPEAALIRQQIEKLQALADRDLEPVIAAKRQKLDALLTKPDADPELLAKLSDPLTYQAATYEELTVILHRVVAAIQITKQVPTELRLRS
ncbi:MAG: recombinase family protein [Vulcanococcus sp.]